MLILMLKEMPYITAMETIFCGKKCDCETESENLLLCKQELEENETSGKRSS